MRLTKFSGFNWRWFQQWLMEIVLYQAHVGPKLANFWDIMGMKSVKPWGDANISSKDFGAPALKKNPSWVFDPGKIGVNSGSNYQQAPRFIQPKAKGNYCKQQFMG